MQPAVVGGNSKAIFVDLGIEHPSGFAGEGIDGGDLRQRCRGVEHLADHQRRRFIGAAGTDFWIGRLDRHVRRFPAPGDVQILGVAAVDLGQWRIAGRRIAPGVSGPIAAHQRCRRFRECAGNGLRVERGWQQREPNADRQGQPPPFSFAQGRLPDFPGEHRPDDNRSQRGFSESAARTDCRVRNAPSLNHLRRRKFAHIAARFDLKCRMLNVETV